jgi:hypothetical protein
VQGNWRSQRSFSLNEHQYSCFLGAVLTYLRHSAQLSVASLRLRLWSIWSLVGLELDVRVGNTDVLDKSLDGDE